MRKRAIKSNVGLILLSFTLWMFITLCLQAKAHGMVGSADFLWEQRKTDDQKKTRFTQTYDVTFLRKLPPLYDAGLKLEFRSETREEEGKMELVGVPETATFKLTRLQVGMVLAWYDCAMRVRFVHDEEHEMAGHLHRVLCQWEGKQRRDDGGNQMQHPVL